MTRVRVPARLLAGMLAATVVVAIWGLTPDHTPTATLRERLKSENATLVPMFSSDKDTGTLWRAGEMGYGRNPIVTAKTMAERPPGRPEEGGYAYFLGPDQELIEAGGGPGEADSFNHVHVLDGMAIMLVERKP